jgi:hypothetical protein
MILTLDVCLFPHSASTQSEYTEEVLFTIPWGEDEGEISTWWNEELYGEGWDMVPPPDPFVVSDSGGMVIFDGYCDAGHLMHYSLDGSLIGFLDMHALGLSRTYVMAIDPTGQVAMACESRMLLLGPDLQINRDDRGPVPIHGDEEVSIYRICPSDHGTFRVLFRGSRILPDDTQQEHGYLAEYGPDGWAPDPLEFFSGDSAWDLWGHHNFVTPDGLILPEITDVYGCTYEFDYHGCNAVMTKFSPDCEEIYTHTIASEPGWTSFDLTSHYCIAWSGNFYTIHATPEGAVVTKFTLVAE